MQKTNNLNEESHQLNFTAVIACIFLVSSFLPLLPVTLLNGSFHFSISRICFILLLGIAGWKTLNRRCSISQLFWKKDKYAIIFHFVWLLYALLSIFWVKDYLAWFKSIFFLSVGFVSIISAQKYIDSDRKIDNILVLISMVIIVSLCIGIRDVFTGNYLFIDEPRLPKYRANRYPASWFCNTNDFATLMFVGFNVCFTLIHTLKNRLLKIMYSIAASGTLVLTLYTTSRANMYGLIISGTVILLCGLYLKKPRIIVSLILVVLVSLIVFVYARPGTLNITRYVESSKLEVSSIDYAELSKSKISSADQALREQDVPSSSDNIRVNLLLNGYVFLKKTFGFGVGSGNTEYWMENFSIYPVGGVTNIHNWWGEILTNYGIIIFVGYMIYYCRIGLSSLIEVLQSRAKIQVPYISIMSISILGGFVFSLMSSSSNFSAEWLWAFFGILSAHQNNIASSSCKQGSKQECCSDSILNDKRVD
jgi:teichuronic acid biosynthesis protein TuaE